MEAQVTVLLQEGARSLVSAAVSDERYHSCLTVPVQEQQKRSLTLPERILMAQIHAMLAQVACQRSQSESVCESALLAVSDFVMAWQHVIALLQAEPQPAGEDKLAAPEVPDVENFAAWSKFTLSDEARVFIASSPLAVGHLEPLLHYGRWLASYLQQQGLHCYALPVLLFLEVVFLGNSKFSSTHNLIILDLVLLYRALESSGVASLEQLWSEFHCIAITVNTHEHTGPAPSQTEIEQIRRATNSTLRRRQRLQSRCLSCVNTS